MKTVVIFNSKTGFTERYAQWIAEKSNADCYELKSAKKRNLAAYDTIIFGGWAIMGSISKIKWFKKNLNQWQGKKLIVFCVGASPANNPEIVPSLEKKFCESELKKINLFYCPGGFKYEKMSAGFKLMLKMFIKELKSKKDKTAEDLEKIKMLSQSYDISDIKYIEPILDCMEII